MFFCGCESCSAASLSPCPHLDFSSSSSSSFVARCFKNFLFSPSQHQHHRSSTTSCRARSATACAGGVCMLAWRMLSGRAAYIGAAAAAATSSARNRLAATIRCRLPLSPCAASRQGLLRGTRRSCHAAAAAEAAEAPTTAGGSSTMAAGAVAAERQTVREMQRSQTRRHSCCGQHHLCHLRS